MKTCVTIIVLFLTIALNSQVITWRDKIFNVVFRPYPTLFQTRTDTVKWTGEKLDIDFFYTHFRIPGYLLKETSVGQPTQSDNKTEQPKSFKVYYQENTDCIFKAYLPTKKPFDQILTNLNRLYKVQYNSLGQITELTSIFDINVSYVFHYDVQGEIAKAESRYNNKTSYDVTVIK